VSGGRAWTGVHDTWLRRQRFDNRAMQWTFESDHEAVLAVKARHDRLDTAIGEMAADSEFTPLVRRLACLRGVSTLTAFALAVELGDWHQFTVSSIGSFVGLVPREYASGASRVQGSITKARTADRVRLRSHQRPGERHHHAPQQIGARLR
jgi:transposase